MHVMIQLHCNPKEGLWPNLHSNKKKGELDKSEKYL